MIAFTGLTLCTKRFKEAEEILLTFARYIRHGIVPNMFPDDNMPPLYNTVDASLWYFYAVYQYLHYNPAAEAEAFVKEQIFPHLKEIISAYEKGTDFSIYMEDDGLIHATLISFALIYNTIRLAIYSKRFLIHTMKLVGAYPQKCR